MPGLVGIAQRGRSLGLHMVLATQRPAGVVTNDIRANTNLRISLRVTDVHRQRRRAGRARRGEHLPGHPGPRPGPARPPLGHELPDRLRGRPAPAGRRCSAGGADARGAGRCSPAADPARGRAACSPPMRCPPTRTRRCGSPRCPGSDSAAPSGYGRDDEDEFARPRRGRGSDRPDGAGRRDPGGGPDCPATQPQPSPWLPPLPDALNLFDLPEPPPHPPATGGWCRPRGPARTCRGLQVQPTGAARPRTSSGTCTSSACRAQAGRRRCGPSPPRWPAPTPAPMCTSTPWTRPAVP